MQDRYAGDIGDYVKFSLLRTLASGRKLGVAWWLTPNQSGNEDGRYTTYLQRADEWKSRNEPVFELLTRVVQGKRSVAALQAIGVLPDARFADERLDNRSRKKSERAQHRSDWFDRMASALEGCDLVFLDPDNGIEADGYDVEEPDSNKSVSIAELQKLRRPERTLVVYHHQTRRLGGHLEEIDYLHQRLKASEGLVPAGALRASPWSARAFFLINASSKDVDAAEAFAEHWKDDCTWYPAHP